jgi:hypothetical protein
VSQRCQFRLRHGIGEALDGVVAGVDLHQHGRAWPTLLQGLAEVSQVRAIGGAHLHQPGARTLHDVRHPEGAADLDQFAARDDDPLALGQGIEQQEYGRRIVVNHGGGLGTGEFAQQRLDHIVAVAPATLVDVVFEGAGVARGGDQGCDRLFGQGGAAQVGVQDRAG